MEKFDKVEREELFRKNIELINSKNVKKIFQAVYTRVQEYDTKIFYDFLGELLLEKPELLDGKKIHKYLAFVKKVRIPRKRQIELETYFFKKYSLFDGEKLLISFDGALRYKKYRYLGRIFITNHRIIVMGKAAEMRPFQI